MHVERVDAGRDHRVGEAVERCSSVSWSSMPMRHLTVTGMSVASRMARDAVGDQRRLGHQAGAEAAGLHPVRRAADIEVDLVIAELRGDPRRFGQLARIGAAKLQRHRMLHRIKAQQALARAMHDGGARHHLGEEQRAAVSSRWRKRQ